MLALKLFEKYIPYALPFLLVFFRGLADFAVLLVGLMFLFKSYREASWTWINETWFKFSLLFVIYLSTFNAFLSINPSDSLLYALTFLRWSIFASALYFWIFKKNEALLSKLNFPHSDIGESKSLIERQNAKLKKNLKDYEGKLSLIVDAAEFNEMIFTKLINCFVVLLKSKKINIKLKQLIKVLAERFN